MLEKANWISAKKASGCPELSRSFAISTPITGALLRITALGVYTATLNGSRIGKFHLAPGWTLYQKRLQVQEYDVTELLQSGENTVSVKLGSGWYSGQIAHCRIPNDPRPALLAELILSYRNGTQIIVTDRSWSARESKTREADIYQGETFDATFDSSESQDVEIRDLPKSMLLAQQGEEVVERETLFPVRILQTPNGEHVVDFGQEITGVARLEVCEAAGTKITLSCAEVLDKDGNFYNENYRSAKSEMTYICGGKHEIWQPELTFYGFRYLRVHGVNPSNIRLSAIVLMSDIRRTGKLVCGNQKLNRLFENIIWGQKGNFLDIPTDCPQRDERQGWTGDAQVFINAACWQYDVKRFFTKWLEDLKADQRSNGLIPTSVPFVWGTPGQTNLQTSAGWGDAATVCPWTLYRHYGDLALLRSHFFMMKEWVRFMTDCSRLPYLWIEPSNQSGHYGDWLGLDAKDGSYSGASNPDLIASAFYYYSTSLVVQAGRALGEDITEYEKRLPSIRRAFAERFPTCHTQTECALVLYVGVSEQPKPIAEKLATLIRENGNRLSTGFIGTPYLLFALSQNGYEDIAYTLLLQEKFPSWLYSVNQGATTVWEHWDGKREDGSFWSKDMNSFNHYAYGSVASWVFEYAGGITPLLPGFRRVKIAPHPDKRLGWLSVSHEIAEGVISVKWSYEASRIRYDISTPVPAEIEINGKTASVKPGTYLF